MFQDTDNDEDQGQAAGNVQESIAVERTRKNSRKLCSLSTYMITYALPVIEEAILTTYREAKINSKFKMWKDVVTLSFSHMYLSWVVSMV